MSNIIPAPPGSKLLKAWLQEDGTYDVETAPLAAIAVVEWRYGGVDGMSFTGETVQDTEADAAAMEIDGAVYSGAYHYRSSDAWLQALSRRRHQQGNHP